ncbi:MAG: TetR/AcrR family transcriptional regulator [Actinomycetes bacterium]
MPVPDASTTNATPRTKPAAQRRRELLDAGLEVFTDRGVATATVDQITRAAGVAKGTFYLHFETKEHLLAALQADFESRLVERLDAATAAAGDDPGAQLTAWVDAAFRHYPADTAQHDVLFHHPVLPERHQDTGERREMVDSLAGLIERGHAAGAFDVDDAELTAMLLCSALHLMFDRIWHRDGDFALDRIRAATHQLFRRAVGRPD